MKKKSNARLVVSAVLLAAAVMGGCSSKPDARANANAAAGNANAAKTPAAIPANAPRGAEPPNMSGSPNALVTLEEFADFQCGSCAVAHPAINEIKSIYGSRIRFIFRNFPLSIAAHDKSYEAAVAAEAAGLQGKFWDMQNLLFTNQKAWTLSPKYKQTWKDYAQTIGLDVAKWETDMDGMKAKSRVEADVERGKALGINATPTLYINNLEVGFAEMNVPELKQMIDAELQKAGPQKDAQAANTQSAAGNQNK